MADPKPGSVQQANLETELDNLEESLASMENLDRSSPDLWPERYPGISDFISSYSNNSNSKQPYSQEFDAEDQNYLHQLASLSAQALIARVKELHDIAYQLGVEESKEMTRGKYLKVFSKSRKDK